MSRGNQVDRIFPAPKGAYRDHPVPRENTQAQLLFLGQSKQQ
jgi:hypothetical protein